MEEKKEITKQARRFAKAMKAPLIFCSSSHSINIQKIFKIVLSKVFDLKCCNVKKITEVGDPIIEYDDEAKTDGGAGGDADDGPDDEPKAVAAPAQAGGGGAPGGTPAATDAPAAS